MTETALCECRFTRHQLCRKDGTFTNTERRVQRSPAKLLNQGDKREDYEIFCEVMTRNGAILVRMNLQRNYERNFFLTPSFGGINYERLEKESLQWPCRQLDRSRYADYACEQFARGKGLFKAIPYKQAQELPDEEYPYLMSTGRMLYHYNTRAMTGRTEGINQIANHSYIEINAVDAQALRNPRR